MSNPKLVVMTLERKYHAFLVSTIKKVNLDLVSDLKTACAMPAKATKDSVRLA